jgi:hypothetical protein
MMMKEREKEKKPLSEVPNQTNEFFFLFSISLSLSFTNEA